MERREIDVNVETTLDYDSTDSGPNIVTPPVFRRQLMIVDIIGNYYTSIEGRLLFNTKIDETFYACLSQWIDIFDTILKNKIKIATIVNRGNEKDCESNSQ